MELRLYFSSGKRPELVRTEFDLSSGGKASAPQVAVRGKTPGAHHTHHTFQWSKAVKALCVIALSEKIRAENLPLPLTGGVGSLAASLDYAITKEPQWIRDIFGSDTKGKSFAKRLFLRTNPNQKRSGPVSVRFNPTLLAPYQIFIFVGRKPVISRRKLEALLRQIVPQIQTVLSSPPPLQLDPEHLSLALQVYYASFLKFFPKIEIRKTDNEPLLSELSISAILHKYCSSAALTLCALEQHRGIAIQKFFGPLTASRIQRLLTEEKWFLLCDLTPHAISQFSERFPSLEFQTIFPIPPEPYCVGPNRNRLLFPLIRLLDDSTLRSSIQRVSMFSHNRKLVVVGDKNSAGLSLIQAAVERTLLSLEASPLEFRDGFVAAAKSRAFTHAIRRYYKTSKEFSINAGEGRRAESSRDTDGDLTFHPEVAPEEFFELS
ncbi:MAG: hypothetical protein KDD64_06840 [Bdellovibrionales bacterium]|nr:hypothetical protein [Bdellovibrionales bacterium]